MKISLLFLTFVIISGVSLIGINQAFALACTSFVAGTWNNPSTWTNCDNGVPDDLGDIAIIGTDAVVQLNNDFVVGSVGVAEGGSLSINAKLTTVTLESNRPSDLFINCSGEIIITSVSEGGKNRGLLTNHGILRTLAGVSFTNSGTYQSSGTDIFGGPFSGNDIERIASICVVGGNLVPIDSTALLLAGAQTFSWMIPVVLSVLGIGLFVVSRKSE